MPRKRKVNEEEKKTEWTMTQLFFKLLELPEFSGEDFSRICAAAKVNPRHYTKIAGNLFKSFQTSGYIIKLNKFIMSERDSQPLPVWKPIPKAPEKNKK
jgi:hypothetical protein